MSLMLNTGLPSVSGKNSLTSYFPIRTKDRRDAFNWDTVLGHFVKYSYCKDLKNNDIELFKEACKKSFVSKLDDENLWETLDVMYFHNDGLFEISPELLLFKAQKIKGTAPDGRLGEFYNNLLNGFYFKNKPTSKLNFLEQEIVNTFEKQTISGISDGGIVKKSNENPYLPFLADLFTEDLSFLGTKPKYLLASFKDFLKLYAFLYTSQLALNLKEWRNGEPVSKPCYFIVDNEKASDERTHIRSHGFKQLTKSLKNLFPYLAMNESLQESGAHKVPIWSLANKIDKTEDNLSLLNEYKNNFAEDRGLSSKIQDATDCLSAIDNLLQLSVEQFKRGESRHEINVMYSRTVESELCGQFIQSRGRAGRVLVFNQDLLILLTNLAIGENEKVRFHELITSFESRGVYFDKQSQQVLIDLYERIGNVERMSDSGDAVYVRKTI